MPSVCSWCETYYWRGHPCDCGKSTFVGDGIGPQKKPASLARLKAIVQQAITLIEELEAPNAN
ncbi:hypothetical protein K2D_16580 [Planctomycetes bacterium K2D]|nr:hypothetical protein K2D_16580 [Planctomycetes bacterium K2D]